MRSVWVLPVSRTVLQKMADRQERKTAAAHGGRLTPRSGAGWVHKGDVSTEDEVIECKATGKTQITLKASWLEKVFNEAVRKLKRPVLEIELNGVSYVVLNRHHYIELKNSSSGAKMD